MNECSICGGNKVLLGTLGRLDHYRCRNCGMMSSTANEDPLPRDIKDVPADERGYVDLRWRDG